MFRVKYSCRFVADSKDERDGGDYSDEFALTGRGDDLRRYMEVVNRVEAERSAGFEEDGGR